MWKPYPNIWKIGRMWYQKWGNCYAETTSLHSVHKNMFYTVWLIGRLIFSLNKLDNIRLDKCNICCCLFRHHIGIYNKLHATLNSLWWYFWGKVGYIRIHTCQCKLLVLKPSVFILCRQFLICNACSMNNPDKRLVDVFHKWQWSL